MRRRDALAVMAPLLRNAVVVPVYSTAFDWEDVAQGHPFTLTRVGAMGLASSFGLGLALACPDRTIVVLDGDGSALMNLGSFVTIGAVSPTNLVHVVVDNGAYEANGGHPVPGSGNFQFEALARASGYSTAITVSTLDELEAELPGILAARGARFMSLKVDLEPSGFFTAEQYRTLYAVERVDQLRRVLCS